MKIFCIVGLGNPGKKYENTRHNLGFEVLNNLIQGSNCFQQSDISFKVNKKFNSELLEADFRGSKVLLVKPQTFMNLSGRAVKKIVDFYKIDLEDLMVVHDDIDFELGKAKLSFNSGFGGHRGVESIINELGGNDFYRLRLGIRNSKIIEKLKIPTDKYVLGKFLPEEIEEVDIMIKKGCEGISLFFDGNMLATTQEING